MNACCEREPDLLQEATEDKRIVHVDSALTGLPAELPDPKAEWRRRGCGGLVASGQIFLAIGTTSHVATWLGDDLVGPK